MGCTSLVHVCEVKPAPANWLYLAGGWVLGLTRTGRRDRPRWYHYLEPVSGDGAAGYTLRGQRVRPHTKTAMEQGMAHHEATPRVCGPTGQNVPPECFKNGVGS